MRRATPVLFGLFCLAVVFSSACTDGVSVPKLPDRMLDAALAADMAPEPTPDVSPPAPDAAQPVLDGTARDGAATDGLASDANTDATPGADAALDDFDALMAEGLRLLAVAQTHDARAVFERAHAVRPENANARFAFALSRTLDALELAGMLLTLPGQLAGISRSEALAESLHGEFLDIRDDLAAGIDLTDGLDPNSVALDVEAAWLYLSVEPILVYRGRFDGGDVHLLRAAGSFMVGFLDVLAGNDLRTDLFGLINGIGGLGGLGFDFRSLGNLLGRLLNTDGGHFLQVHPEAGPDLWLDSQQRFSAVGRELNAAIAWMAVEPPSDVPQVSFATPLRGDSGFTLSVNGLASMDDDFVLTERPYTIELSNALLAAFDHASRAIVSPGDVVDFQTEFLPILSVIVHAATRTRVLDALLGALPIDLSLLNRLALETLLKTLLPLPMGMVPGSLYAGPPVGLRLILPRVTEGDAPTFIAEWECPEVVGADGLLPGKGWTCPADAVLVDAPHFGGDLPADGLAVPGPYLRFDDAAMSGLARVDLSELGLPDAPMPGWVVPDEAALATALATRLAPLLNLIGGL